MAKRATAKAATDKPKGRGGRRARNLPNTTVAQEQEIQRGMTAQEALDKHFDTIKKLKTELDKEQETAKKIVGEVKGRYRSALRVFKKDGGDIDVLIETLNDLKLDQDVVIKKHLDRQRYGVHAGTLPQGTQLSMFPNVMPSAAKQDEEEGEEISSEASIAKAKTEGYAAGKDGKFMTANPYDDGSPERLAWGAEWRRAQDELAAKFGQKTEPETEPAVA